MTISLILPLNATHIHSSIESKIEVMWYSEIILVQSVTLPKNAYGTENYGK